MPLPPPYFFLVAGLGPFLFLFFSLSSPPSSSLRLGIQSGAGILLFSFLDSGIHHLMGLVGCVLLFRHVVVMVAKGGYRNKIVMCSEVGDFVAEVPLDLKSGGICAIGILFVLHSTSPLIISTNITTTIIPNSKTVHHSRAIGGHRTTPTPSLHPARGTKERPSTETLRAHRIQPEQMGQ